MSWWFIQQSVVSNSIWYICVGYTLRPSYAYESVNWDIIGSDNGLSVQRQAIIWNNTGLLFNGALGTNCSKISFQINIFSFKKSIGKRRLQMAVILSRLQCVYNKQLVGRKSSVLSVTFANVREHHLLPTFIMHSTTRQRIPNEIW